MAVNIKTYAKAPATVQVEMLRGCYAKWDGELYDGHYEIVTEEIQGTLQKTRKFVGDVFWVPAPVAERWTNPHNNNRPLCVVKATRTVEEARGASKPPVIENTNKPKGTNKLQEANTSR